MPSLRVEVVYALPDRQTIVDCEVEQGASVRDCLIASGVLRVYPDIDLHAVDVGIWSERVSLDSPVREGDRIEIYRPLVADPKLVRRQRAGKNNSMRRQR